MFKANKHVMECVEMDDGGSRVCLGCRQWVHGNVTETPPGECPTPYKSPKQLLDESVAREAALREELAGLQHWRDLALQFDNHRMAALWHLKALLQSQEHAGPANDFLDSPPLAAHEVTAKLTAAEQRNAQMYGFLERMLKGCGTDLLAAWQSEMEMVLTDAAFKPTESEGLTASPWTPLSAGKHEDGIRYIGAANAFIVGDVFHGYGSLVVGRMAEEGYAARQSVKCWRYSDSSEQVPEHLTPTHLQPLPEPPVPRKKIEPFIFSDSPDGAAAEAVYLRQVAAEDRFNGQ